MRLVQKERMIPEWKRKAVDEVAGLIRKHKVIGIVDLSNVENNILQKVKTILRDKYGDQLVLKTIKNNIFRLAAEKAGLKGRELLDPYLTGQRLFIFTDMNPFFLNRLLKLIRIPAPAKPGMVIDKEIVVEPMDTGLPPGPLLSAFGKLRIPTRVQGGTIWIAKRTKIAKPGDVVSLDLASMLVRLGIYPRKAGLDLLLALDDGILLKAEDLSINVEEYREKISRAFAEAVAVGVEAAVPVPMILEKSVAKAYARAIEVAYRASYLTPENAHDIISRAVARAYTIIFALGEKAKELGIEGIPSTPMPPAPQPAEKEEEKKEEEEEEEEEKKELSEEELASGLGALFG